MGHPSVDHHVVEAEVGRPVGGHPEAHGQQGGVPVGPVIDEDDGRDREEDAEQVVGLEEAGARPVVGGMEHP